MRKPIEKGSGKIEFNEKVRDPNGRNIFVKGVNLKSINGSVFDQKNPDWISWKITKDKINEDGSRLKIISIKINNSRLNENVNYVFELVSSNGKEESTRKITVSVISSIQKEFNILNNVEDNFLISKLEFSYLPIYKKVNKKDSLRNLKEIVFNRKQNQLSFDSPNIILK